MRSESDIRFYLKTTFGILFLFFYCEYLIYYIILKDCGWPVLDPNTEDPNIEITSGQEPVKVMILSDTHLLGSRNGHWFDKLRREWQMHRAFQTAMTLHKPDLVFVLGDLTDEGLYCSSVEFDYYVKRFYDLFRVPDTTKIYVAVGNHDIGFHYGVSPYLNQRFVTGFNSPAVQLISLRGIHFVLVNSMALEGDGCFLCKPAEKQLMKIESKKIIGVSRTNAFLEILQCTKGTSSTKCDPKLKLETYSRPILMQHYPLYRQSDMDCKDFDAAPLPVRQERFRERWECLSQEATLQLLNQVKPRLALSGHTHHGCTRKLQVGDGVEITIPSFSWRNKENPNYGLGIFTANNYAFSKCEMPRENTVIVLYMIGGSLLLIWLIYSIFTRSRKYKYKLRCR